MLGLAVSARRSASGLLITRRVHRRLAASWRCGALALALDSGGPYLFGIDGWKLVPGHFAERHGAIIIIALGESIVAIGVAAKPTIGAGVVAAAVLGVVISAALWWVYFDVAAIVAARRLASAARGREQNEIARDSYSYLHFPMVAGVALIAVGLKLTLEHVDAPLRLMPAVALLGGGAMYLLAHVAFRCATCTRSAFAAFCARSGAARADPGWARPARACHGRHPRRVLCALIAYEALRFAEPRDRVRHQVASLDIAHWCVIATFSPVACSTSRGQSHRRLPDRRNPSDVVSPAGS